ncbi:hypothetical protein ASG47_19660 [Devosia sp. Leaf420]|uniref:helix-turn-helix domain-containing protein n=1 Tax=Devosia sp. Leaf420 TaxID=1736374 RepID=UPI0007152482|nr:helix-turn-helix domain-containing protein [Devosia sp. Leaf420]KQT50322.1 hypothetical protein ASG47_19660 [Devosia sp. Leaf420]
MSYVAAYWAAKQRGIGPYGRVLLQQLADRHNVDLGCFPHQKTLARDCEFSRSTINEQLKKLEQAGLIKRVTSRHPVTNRQEPTRYYLQFEEGFADIVGAETAEASEQDDDESRVREPDTDPDDTRVREPDTAFDASRVRATGEAESGSDAEPCPPARTRNSSLTGKITGNGTGKRAERADRASLFKSIWKMFPLRPGSSEDETWELFKKLDEVDLPAIEKAVERYDQFFRERAAGKGETYQDACNFAPYLITWLRKRQWLEAKTWPVSAKLGTEAAAVMAGKVTINKWRQYDLFLACEQVLGRSVPVGKTGSWSFDEAVVEEANKRLGSGSGPP